MYETMIILPRRSFTIQYVSFKTIPRDRFIWWTVYSCIKPIGNVQMQLLGSSFFDLNDYLNLWIGVILLTNPPFNFFKFVTFSIVSSKSYTYKHAFHAFTNASLHIYVFIYKHTHNTKPLPSFTFKKLQSFEALVATLSGLTALGPLGATKAS